MRFSPSLYANPLAKLRLYARNGVISVCLTHSALVGQRGSQNRTYQGLHPSLDKGRWDDKVFQVQGLAPNSPAKMKLVKGTQPSNLTVMTSALSYFWGEGRREHAPRLNRAV